MYRYEYETITCEFGGWVLAISTALKITAPSLTGEPKMVGDM